VNINKLEAKLEKDGFTLINDTVLALGYGTRTFEKTEKNGEQVIITITYCKTADEYPI
jgi:hypothetical protein